MLIEKQMPLPDPSIPDPCMQTVLPNFLFLQFGAERSGTARSFCCALPSLQQLQELHFGLCAVTELMQSRTFRRVCHSSAGDQASYYSFSKEVTVPSDMYRRLPEQGAIASATIRFPAIEEEHRMSPLQRMGFAESSVPLRGTVKTDYDQPFACPNEETSLEDLETSRAIMKKKGDGNMLYTDGDFAGAHSFYSQAVVEYEQLLEGVKARNGGVVSDWSLQSCLLNLYNNRAQASLKLENFEEVISDTTIIISHLNKLDINLYTTRAVYARAQAYHKSEKYTESVEDYDLLLDMLPRDRADRQVPSRHQISRELSQVRAKKDQEDSQIVWHQIHSKTSMGDMSHAAQRFRHSAVLHPDATSILVYGGCTDLKAHEAKDDKLYSLDIATSTVTVTVTVQGAQPSGTCSPWVQLPATGVCPPPMNCHTAVVHDRTMYMLGCDAARDYKAEMYAYNVDTAEWSRVVTRGQHQDAQGHTANVYEDRMYVFGGATRETRCSVLSVFDFKTHHWSQPAQSTHNQPSARSLHMSWITADNHLVIHAGTDNEGVVGCMDKTLCDTYAFDLESNHWLGKVCHWTNEYELLQLSTCYCSITYSG
jgi:tetratricopeptide (TPR) repeat protein